LPILLLSLFIGIYIEYRIKGDYILIPEKLGYSDIIIVLLFIFLCICIRSFFSSSKSNKPKTNVQSDFHFLEDKPINNTERDILDYSESAKLLAKDLESINSSCSIGLIAPWGTGKTSYLNLLETHLSKEKFIVIKFNPRHSRQVKNIQEDFFEGLFSKLKRYDLRFLFNDYLKAINIIDKNIWSVLFDKIWDKKSEKGKIEEAIKWLNKKIIVIIDDFDRLLPDEIIEVVKLIDENASFSNLIFITAYDKKRINKIIGKQYSNEDTSFSDKYFNLEIPIPIRPYSKIYEFLHDNLFKELTINIENRDSYEAILNRYFELLKQYLPTIRDVKRFLNLFVRQYKQIEGEIEFEDYFLLYLIKYKYWNEYFNLSKKEYVSKNIMKANCYCLNEQIDTQIESKSILEILFSKASEDSFRSINNEKAFDIYFHEYIYDGLSLKEMKPIFDKDFNKEVKLFIDTSVFDKKFGDFRSFLKSKNILTFKDKSQFERYLDILLYINCKDYDTDMPSSTLLTLLSKESEKQLSEIYSYKDKEYTDLILSKLKGDYPDYPFNITRKILIELVNNNFPREIIFSKEDILNVSKSALDNLIDNERQINQKHINLLYSCITTHISSLDKESCSKIKGLIEQNPSGYFENFVGLGMIFSSHPDFNLVKCNLSWEEIFGSKEEMEAFIGTHQSTIPKIQLVNNFWKLYKNNAYKPIEFRYQGNVQEKIDNNLENEIKELDKLLEIEKEFESMRATTPQELQVFLDRIDGIHLYITKRGEIIQKIKTLQGEIN
jgi:hypothetical protein